MTASSAATFISFLMLTQATLANGLPTESAQIFVNMAARNGTADAWSSSVVTTTGPTSNSAPVQAQVPSTSTGPVQAQVPYAKCGGEIPQITVDLAKQTAHIWYVGQPTPIEVPISSGGNLKEPDGKDRLQDGTLDPMQIYCGHWENRRAKGGVVANPFKGNMEDEGSRSEEYTTYPRYVSSAFDNGDGTGGVPMPWAIRVPRDIQISETRVIEDNSTRPKTTIDCGKLLKEGKENRRCSPRAGIFIHERPGTEFARDNIGKNPVSGGCIRLPRKEDLARLNIPWSEKIGPAQKLHDETNKCGGINIEIMNNPPESAEDTKRNPLACNQAKVNVARDKVVATRIARDRSFGDSIACLWSDCSREADIARAREKREAARAAQIAKELAAGRQ